MRDNKLDAYYEIIDLYAEKKYFYIDEKYNKEIERLKKEDKARNLYLDKVKECINTNFYNEKRKERLLCFLDTRADDAFISDATEKEIKIKIKESNNKKQEVERERTEIKTMISAVDSYAEARALLVDYGVIDKNTGKMIEFEA